jgi:peptidyl-prolyl cis-trans isomerase C
MKLVNFSVFLASLAGLYAQTAPVVPPPRVVITPANPSLSLPTASIPPDKVVLTIGTEKVTAADFEQLVDALPEQYRAAARGPNKRQFAEQIVRVRILSSEARKRKLDQSPALQRQLELQKENLLANALFQDMTANAQVDDATARQYFEQHKSEYETVHARHILIRVKGSPLPGQPGKKELSDDEALAKAQEIHKKLLAGEDFATLAKTESDDVRSGANGGDLGSFKREQMAPPFAQAAFSLPAGQLSEPVKTQFGYHLIKVEQHDVKSFDDAKSELEKRIRPELARSAVENLQKQTPVVMDESFFGPAPAPAAAK